MNKLIILAIVCVAFAPAVENAPPGDDATSEQNGQQESTENFVTIEELSSPKDKLETVLAKLLPEDAPMEGDKSVYDDFCKEARTYVVDQLKDANNRVVADNFQKFFTMLDISEVTDGMTEYANKAADEIRTDWRKLGPAFGDWAKEAALRTVQHYTGLFEDNKRKIKELRHSESLEKLCEKAIDINRGFKNMLTKYTGDLKKKNTPFTFMSSDNIGCIAIYRVNVVMKGCNLVTMLQSTMGFNF